MSKIEWESSFSVNVPEIDEQHKKWIKIINELHDVMVDGNLKEVIEAPGKALTEMRDYTRHHFLSEEEFMKKINYPDFSSHKQIHDKFYVEVNQLYLDVTEGKTVLNTETMSMLTTWLRDHILKEDKKFIEFV